MSLGARGSQGDRLGLWCGWVLIGAAAAVPLLAWLAPLGFSMLLALVGLLCLPAIRVPREDQPVAGLLMALLLWAAVSTHWSPFHPARPQASTLLKLGLQAPLYWSALCAARRADPRLARRALRVLAWGCAALGVVLALEAATHAAIFKALHAFYGPIRPDLAEARVGHSTYVLALIWPLAALGAPARVRPWLALAMVVGAAAAALAFGADAPVLSLALAPLAAAAVWRWPRPAPRVIGAAAFGLTLAMPIIVWGVRRFGDYARIERAIPLSYAERMGYWSRAIDWIRARPLRGWGLDASRTFGPGIQLHPHNGPLQVWLELGVVGAVAAAAFWFVALGRLSRREHSPVVAATAASAAVYLLFGLVNFGLWQEWWLALGALVAALSALNVTAAKPRPSTGTPHPD